MAAVEVVTITMSDSSLVNIANGVGARVLVITSTGTGTGIISTEVTLSGGGTLDGFAGEGPYFVNWTPPADAEGSATITVALNALEEGNPVATLVIPYDFLAPDAPDPLLITPVDAATVGAAFTIQGSVPDGASQITVDGTPATLLSGNTTWSLAFTGQSAGGLSLDVIAIDAMENPSQATTINLTVDTAPPVLGVTSPGGDGFHSSTTLDMEGTCDDSDAVITIQDGATTHPATLAGGVWSISLSSLSEGAHALLVRATDPAGNQASVIRTITVDTQGPLVTVGVPTASQVGASSSVDIPVTFSDAGEGTVETSAFGPTDIEFDATVGVTADVAIQDQGAGVYTLTLSNVLGTGTIRARVKAGAESAEVAVDGLGNRSQVSDWSSTLTVDNTAPAIQTITPTTYTASTSPDTLVTVVFSEAVASVGATSATATFGTWAMVGSDPLMWRATMTATAEGDYGISELTATDLAGNVLTDNNGNTGWTLGSWDTTGPASVTVSGADTERSANPEKDVTLTFLEPVTVSAIVASNATAGTPSSNGDGTIWTVRLTELTADSTFGIASITAADLAGNSVTFTNGWDTGFYEAGVVVTATVPVPAVGATSIVFTVTFAEDIANPLDFIPADLLLGGTSIGGTIQSVDRVTDQQFTVTVAGMTGSGTVQLTVPADVVQAVLSGEYNAPLITSVTWTAAAGSGGSGSSGGGGGGGCGAGTAAGLLIASLGLLGLRRRRI
ncbi:MAG TPA: hypothetical protein DCS97_00300 [Planctomycetes bacterium]|nr:hypothetical protein [Planctomycetota bacterium]